ncbi:uncharacterized protein LOC116221081 isoform X2 [Clupea harengus]|uniref:Uncharacterized protein LOC116221081 isoform X2 n=1 Tax=Clupea harengus TaxID=7950 RepID=A0A6P8FRZ4_CLUHA|nr:uncharacterized protein LOC116221081 isoform X2 [Clupea harengus]
MERWQKLVAVTVVTVTLVSPALVVGLAIRNEQSGRCVAVLKHRERHRLELVDCQPGSALQEWLWDPESCFIKSLAAGECLSAAGTYPKHDGVRLRSCQDGENGGEGQAWSCSKKGQLTLQGARLHLSERHSQEHPTKIRSIYLSKDRGQASQWRTLSNSSVCGESSGVSMCVKRQHSIMHHPTGTPSTPPSSQNENKTPLNPMPQGEGLVAPRPTEQNMSTDFPVQSQSSFAPEKDTVDFFNMDFGRSWKVAMLVLSSLALMLGFVILILSILQNRKKNVVVLKSYTRTGEVSQPGSPALHDRAPLTKNPMRPAHSPSLPRGEILVAWKDGTVTPLFDSNNY